MKIRTEGVERYGPPHSVTVRDGGGSGRRGLRAGAGRPAGRHAPGPDPGARWRGTPPGRAAARSRTPRRPGSRTEPYGRGAGGRAEPYAREPDGSVARVPQAAMARVAGGRRTGAGRSGAYPVARGPRGRIRGPEGLGAFPRRASGCSAPGPGRESPGRESPGPAPERKARRAGVSGLSVPGGPPAGAGPSGRGRKGCRSGGHSGGEPAGPAAARHAPGGSACRAGSGGQLRWSC